MTNIDDSTQTPPGYWFGVIEGRLHERMREALADQGLRRGGWRILHTLAEGPASAAELGEKLPHRGDRGRDRRQDGDRRHDRDRHHDRGRDSDRDPDAAYSEAAERGDRADGHEYARRDHGCEHHAHGGGYGYGAYGEYGHHGYGQRYGDPRHGDARFGDARFGDARFGDARYGDPRPGFTPGGHSHPGLRGQEPRDERPAGADHPTDGQRPGPDPDHAHHNHELHDHDHHEHDLHDHEHHHDGHVAHLGIEHAFERGYEHGFDRGYTFGAARAGQAFPRPFPPAPYGPSHGGHPFAGPFAGSGAPFPGHFPGGFGAPYPGHVPGGFDSPFPGYFPGGFGGPFPGGAPFGGHGHGQGHGGWHPFDGDPRRFGKGHQDGRRHRGDHRIHRIHRIERILADFVERGWVWFDGDRATLTDEGRAAHEAAVERVSAVRAELLNGIAEDDYATTMATLEAMARNLGGRPAQSDEQSEEEDGNEPGAGQDSTPDPTPDAGPASPDSPADGEPKMEA